MSYYSWISLYFLTNNHTRQTLDSGTRSFGRVRIKAATSVKPEREWGAAVADLVLDLFLVLLLDWMTLSYKIKIDKSY